jgi:hypothetical protein
MTRQMFDEMIGTSPVSTVDIDAVIARERRALRGRRTAVVLACTVAVATLLIGGRLVVAGGSQRPVAGPGTVPPTTMRSAATTGPATTGPATTGRATPTGAPVPPADRLSDAMRGAVRNAVPSAEAFNIGSTRPFEAEALTTGDGGYSGQAVVRVAGRAGRVVITVYRGQGPDIPPPGECTAIPGHPCPTKAGTGPNGEKYAGYQRVVGKPTGSPTPAPTGIVAGSPDFEVRENSVDLKRPDGTVVAVMANNMVFTSDLRLAPGSAQPALTVDQLIAVALDPGLDL